MHVLDLNIKKLKENNYLISYWGGNYIDIKAVCYKCMF